MRRERANVVHHPVLGPVPAWCGSLLWRAVLLLVYCGMALGIAVLWPVLAPWPLDLLVARLSKTAQALAVLALMFGALFGTVYFTALEIWQRRLRRSEERATNGSEETAVDGSF